MLMKPEEKRQYHKEHAIHNNSAVKVINKPGKHLDWTITICFYTCLHAVKYKAFPLTFTIGKKNITLNSFEDYCQFTSDTKASKHFKLCDLLHSHYPEIASDYQQLMDMCMTARYHNYKVDREEANRAIEFKNNIYKYCI